MNKTFYNCHDNLNITEVRKPVMFDIPNNDRNLSLLLPHRLERLEPLKGASVLTAEMLSQKMQSVEEKRIKVLYKLNIYYIFHMFIHN